MAAADIQRQLDPRVHLRLIHLLEEVHRSQRLRYCAV
jgi:hypothetical protein